MLHEAEFKDIIGVYKELRKDGVIFPQRNVANQFMIKFEGKKSPIFEGIEHDRIYEEPNKTMNPNKVYEVKPDDLFDHNPFKTKRPPGTKSSTQNNKTKKDDKVEKLEELSEKEFETLQANIESIRESMKIAKSIDDLKRLLIRKIIHR